jgi:hypothetical protein
LTFLASREESEFCECGVGVFAVKRGRLRRGSGKRGLTLFVPHLFTVDIDARAMAGIIGENSS